MLLQQLKQDTRRYHEQIERTLDLPARCQSLDGYRRVLAQFYGFYAPVELALAQITGLSNVLADLDQRRKTALLARDLAALGMSDDNLAAIPLCTALPALPGIPQALGCLYVLEGATLGGQIIARQLHQRLGVTPAGGSAFFSSYGPQTGPMWRAFGEQIVAYAMISASKDDRNAVPDIIAAARETFRAFDHWLLGQEV